MIDPSQFDEMINWAFTIATLIYTVIGVTGYLMFGNSVSDEVRGHIVCRYLTVTLVGSGYSSAKT